MNQQPKPKTAVSQQREKVTVTNLKEVCLTISRFLDAMNSPDFREEHFKQIYTQDKNGAMLSAMNDELFVSFTFKKMKGGKK